MDGVAHQRRAFSVNFKLRVLKEARHQSAYAVAKKQNLKISQITEWRLHEKELSEKAQCAKGSAKSLHKGVRSKSALVEETVLTWFKSVRQQHLPVNRSTLARRIENELSKTRAEGVEDFKITEGSLTRFMQRNNIVMRKRTSISQKTKDGMCEEAWLFSQFYCEKILADNVSEGLVANMDETSVCFESVPSATLDLRGVRHSPIRSAGKHNFSVTVVLCVTMTGRKLKPYVLLPRKTNRGIKIPEGLVVKFNASWMNEELMEDWMQKVWQADAIIDNPQTDTPRDTPLVEQVRAPDFTQRRRILILDSFRAHTTVNVIRKLDEDCATSAVIIPGGLTSVLQPLDVSVNKPFKDNLRRLWTAWIQEESREKTKTGNVKPPDWSTFLNWIVQAWDAVERETVIRGFIHPGLAPLPTPFQDHDSLLSTLTLSQDTETQERLERVSAAASEAARFVIAAMQQQQIE